MHFCFTIKLGFTARMQLSTIIKSVWIICKKFFIYKWNKGIKVFTLPTEYNAKYKFL